MKIYDKNIYKTEQDIKITVIIITSFLLGFIIGYFANSLISKKIENNKINNNNTIIINDTLT